MGGRLKLMLAVIILLATLAWLWRRVRSRVFECPSTLGRMVKVLAQPRISCEMPDAYRALGASRKRPRFLDPAMSLESVM